METKIGHRYSNITAKKINKIERLKQKLHKKGKINQKKSQATNNPRKINQNETKINQTGTSKTFHHHSSFSSTFALITVIMMQSG